MTEIIRTYRINTKNWAPFGKYAINTNSLLKKSLNVKLGKSLTKLATGSTFSRVKTVSEDVCEFLFNILQHKEKFDMSLFFKLIAAEQKLMIELLELSDYGREIGFNYVDAYKNRFKILQGEMGVGNDNPQLRVEAISVIRRLLLLHAIGYKDGQEMIDELNDQSS